MGSEWSYTPQIIDRRTFTFTRRAGFEIVFDLNCPDGPLDVRGIKGKVSDAGVRHTAKLIAPSLPSLCVAWRNIHGNYH